MAAYLNVIEKQTVEWFRSLASEAATRCQAIRLDPLGVLTMTLPPDPPEEAAAWLTYVAAQASGKKAVVNLDEHGILVLILPRYARAKQENLRLAGESGKERRRGREGQEQGPDLGASQGGSERAVGEGENNKADGKK